MGNYMFPSFPTTFFSDFMLGIGNFETHVECRSTGLEELKTEAHGAGVSRSLPATDFLHITWYRHVCRIRLHLAALLV